MNKLVVFLCLSLVFGSCKQDSEDPTPASSPHNQLLLGRWNAVSAEATISQAAGPPITTLLTFPVGTSYDVFTATTVESVRNNVLQRQSMYTLIDSAYTITENGITDTYRIKKLTATELVTNYSYPIRTMAGPGTAVVVSTYTR